jgi:hypothetical protein
LDRIQVQTLKEREREKEREFSGFWHGIEENVNEWFQSDSCEAGFHLLSVRDIVIVVKQGNEEECRERNEEVNNESEPGTLVCWHSVGLFRSLGIWV